MITAIIQARTSSNRLPNKVLLPLGESTVLEQVIDRVKKAKNIEKIVVATSTDKSDDKIVELCKKINVGVFRGSMDDVLGRYYEAAKEFKATDICRITSDCPLIDPVIIDKVVDEYNQKECDYASNSHPVATFPDGLDVWVFSFEALEKSYKEATLESEREHVTSYIWNHPESFKVCSVENSKDQSEYRLTIDEEKDYELIKTIFNKADISSTDSIIKFLDENPDISNLNKSINRDEGYKKSVEKDN
jgi:spore coat polysaccharide biosynthesis protein SpsF (cytidylyltransferase family)